MAARRDETVEASRPAACHAAGVSAYTRGRSCLLPGRPACLAALAYVHEVSKLAIEGNMLLSSCRLHLPVQLRLPVGPLRQWALRRVQAVCQPLSLRVLLRARVPRSSASTARVQRGPLGAALPAAADRVRAVRLQGLQGALGPAPELEADHLSWRRAYAATRTDPASSVGVAAPLDLQAAVPTEIVKVDVVCNCTAKGADLRFSIVVGESACTVGANQATRKSLWSP
jgi:hypothetical protein